MAKVKIAIDIDDVVADSTEALRLLINERTGVELTRQDYRIPGSYRKYYERVWESHNLQDKVVFADVSAEMAIDQSHVPLVEGAIAALESLGGQYHIVAITARDVSWEDATRRWFKSHDSLSGVELYFAGNHHTKEYKTKGELCRELGVELLIDDNPDHCQSALDAGIDSILFGQYGWHLDVSPNVTRCKDWPAVVEYVRSDGPV